MIIEQNVRATCAPWCPDACGRREKAPTPTAHALTVGKHRYSNKKDYNKFA